MINIFKEAIFRVIKVKQFSKSSIEFMLDIY
ncbi:hypothetical protein EZS27_043108, partial [termite gut metagenome]